MLNDSSIAGFKSDKDTPDLVRVLSDDISVPEMVIKQQEEVKKPVEANQF